MSQESLKTGSIDKFQLTASIGSNSVDLSAGISDFRLYESVLSNTVTATAVVVETGTGVKGSIDGLPIRGGENLTFKIRDAQGRSIKSELLVNRLRNANPESTKDLYILDFASPEYFSNDTVRVTERYEGKISDNIGKMLSKLKTTRFIDIDDTLNEYNFMGNDRKPFYVCTWLASKSISKDGGQEGAVGYLFYQTIDSFKFKSVDKLLGQEPIKSFIYNSGEKGGHDDIIINYTIDRDIDLHENLSLGTYSTSVLFFDPLTFSYVVKDYDVSDQKSIMRPKKTESASELINEERRGVSNPNPTQRGISSNNPSRLMNIVYDYGTLPAGKSSEEQLKKFKNDPENKKEQGFSKYGAAALTIMRYNQLFTIQTTITIPGDFSIRAGDTVKVIFPQLEADKNSGKNNKSSGIYMVAHVCHKITPENTLTSLSLVRDSYGK